jgi:RimJ/RimL family protein N-acetyltransferase
MYWRHNNVNAFAKRVAAAHAHNRAPALETKRLALLPLKDARYAGELLSLSLEGETARYIPGLQNQLTGNPFSYRGRADELVIVDKTTQQFKGYINLLWDQDAGGLIYALQKKAKGQGYMTEAVRAVCAYGLQKGYMREIFGVVAASNSASQATLLRAGFNKISQPWHAALRLKPKIFVLRTGQTQG